MVTKAIIESINDTYSVKVRIPLLDSVGDYSDATPSAELSDAIVCTLPRTSYIPEIGDIVIVTFEDNDLGKPIIIGCLFKDSGNLSQINSELNSLKVVANTTLSKDVNIGDISYKELQYLSGLKQNLQGTINNILSRLDNLEGNN